MEGICHFLRVSVVFLGLLFLELVFFLVFGLLVFGFWVKGSQNFRLAIEQRCIDADFLFTRQEGHEVCVRQL